MFKRVTFHLSPADCADHLKAQLENHLRHNLSNRYFNIHEGKDLQFSFVLNDRGNRMTFIDL